jgi:hypothetical protein
MDAFGEFVNETLAGFFAASAIRKAQPQCECPTPVPGDFDLIYYTTCQRCNRALALSVVICRTGNAR